MTGVFYIQSCYSIMESIPTLESLVKKAKENQYDFIALSDDNNLYGMSEFLILCKKYNIKPILGIKIYLSLSNIISSQHKNIGLLVYASNDLGIQNLIKISNLIITQQNNILLKELVKYQEGLFFILSNIDFAFSNLSLDKDSIKRIFKKLKETLNWFFVGLSLQSDYLETCYNDFLSNINDLQIPIVPVHKTNFLEPNQEEAHNLLLKLFHPYQEKLKQESKMSFQFLNKQNFETKYNDHINTYNLNEFISKIEYNNPFSKELKIPTFKQSSENSEDNSFTYLKKKSFNSLKTKISDSSPEFNNYKKRLNKELKIIKDMNFEDYFLIVSDLVDFAKKEEIFIGPGRGSSAGSLICFCLGITEADPLFYNLLFERFLNPKRNKKPDIDLDFPDDKINIISKYIFEKYGQNYTANIITFNPLTRKSFIKNTNYTNYCEKTLGLKNPENDSKQIQILSQLEGIPQITKNHPSGIIISNKNLLEFIPIQKNENSNSPFKYRTQLESKYLDKIGLPKIDLLSLKSLSFIDKILKEINKDKKEKIYWQQFRLDDIKTYQLLQTGDTEYIFQLESLMAKKVLEKVKPNNFEDLIAVLALNRPGQIFYIDDYCRNKEAKKNLLIDDNLNNFIGHILKNTQGIILYQEQIMEIVVHVMGYDFGEAEIFMKYIIEKDNKNISEKNIKQEFLKHSKQKGYSQELSMKIYNYILKFANYSFNKSHSVSYSLISYRMAFLKKHYSIYFFKVILDECRKNVIETRKILTKIKKTNLIKILPPNIFTSDVKYKLTKDNKLLLPLTLIKNISDSVASFIIKEREESKFQDFDDFVNRCQTVLNNNLLKDLVLSGAFDDFRKNRETLLYKSDLDYLINHAPYLKSYEKPVPLEKLPKELLNLDLKKEILRIFNFDLTSFIH